MRAFLALDLPSEHIAALVRLQRELRVGRKMAPETFHLTLVFLGDIRDEVAEDIIDRLSDARLAAPQVALNGVGHFGGDTPRQVWAGVRANPDLTRLAEKATSIARAAGASPERRRFVPHVTIARMTSGAVAPVAAFEATHAQFAAPPFTPLAITLYESHLLPDGARHDPVAAVSLQQN